MCPLSACCQGARNAEARLRILVRSFGASRGWPGPTDRRKAADSPVEIPRLERPERVAGKMEIRNDDSWQ